MLATLIVGVLLKGLALKASVNILLVPQNIIRRSKGPQIVCAAISWKVKLDMIIL